MPEYGCESGRDVTGRARWAQLQAYCSQVRRAAPAKTAVHGALLSKDGRALFLLQSERHGFNLNAEGMSRPRRQMWAGWQHAGQVKQDRGGNIKRWENAEQSERAPQSTRLRAHGGLRRLAPLVNNPGGAPYRRLGLREMGMPLAVQNRQIEIYPK